MVSSTSSTGHRLLEQVPSGIQVQLALRDQGPQGFDGLGVYHHLFQPGAGDLDGADVPVHQQAHQGLGAEAVPQQRVGHLGGPAGLVHLGQPPVVGGVGRQGPARVEERPEHLHSREAPGAASP